MKIKLSPVRIDAVYSASVNGDTLVFDDDTVLDFSPLQEGEVLPGDAIACPWIVGDVTRIEGEVQLTLVLPHGVNAPEETRFPTPVLVMEGVIPFPPYNSEPEVVA